MKKMDYQIIEEKELLQETFAGLLASMDRYLMKQEIEDESHPLYVLRNQVNEVWLDVLGPKYTTMEDMVKLHGQLEFLQTYMRALEE